MDKNTDCIHIKQQCGEVLAWSDSFQYTLLHGVYVSGSMSGFGLQLSANFEHKRGEIEDLLAVIADKAIELGKILNT